ncbi:PucR-like helix-turn-helix protein [Actinocorallia herbida]|uniref:PucR-like helix-turn-helix protein n=1 Tax=Actinocorallia herbida TaxID=58109 RepID=A0A3N1D225_9ACTN|nr:helix-turn-helix domain-containing protein [Actinocorallia herbida]ROO87587.1 PucR-like helix-turn-helix protein [Actinocorallia herbida]
MPLREFIAGLKASGEPVPPVGDPAFLAAAEAVLGPGPVGWAVAMAEHGFQKVLRAVEEERLETFGPRLAEAIERTALDLLLALHEGVGAFTLNAEERDVITYLAGEDIPFSRIVQGLRLVRGEWILALLQLVELHRPARERGALLREVTQEVTDFFDATVDAVINDYLAERQRLLARRAADQRSIVTSIVADEWVTDDTARQVLGIDLGHHHLGLILWQDGEPSSASGAVPGALERAARNAAVALHCPAPLMVAGDAVLWAWLSSPGPIDDGGLPVDPSVRVAAGLSARGLWGFRRTHLAALDAWRVAVSCAQRPTVTRYRDIALVGLLTSDHERAQWFVDEQLGSLAGDDRLTADLRRTLLSYLDNGGSLIRAAADLHVHRNTVVYRLRRAEQLLGHPASAGTTDLHMALRLAEVLPSRPA